MPRRVDREACVPEQVIQPNGEIDTILLDERYTPYVAQEPRIENLCGCFTEEVSLEWLAGAVVSTNSNFGRQREVFHVHGNVAINNNKGLFMGVRDMRGLEKLATALALAHSGNLVHMAVICGKVGARMQVKSSGLLENRLLCHAKHICVEGRLYDHTNTVRMRVRGFTDEGIFALAKQFRPEKNDWTITGKGTVMIRFTWKKIEWTHECEAACLEVCSRIIDKCMREQR
jgi:hypothetical protein